MPTAHHGLIPLLIAGLAGPLIAADGDVTISGELRQWHKVTLDLAGPTASESGEPNPFTDYRMTVTFSQGGTNLTVPGYFAADGDADESSATSGSVWRAHLCPPSTGTWDYVVDFRSGDMVAIHGGGSEVAAYDGGSGSFTVGASDKSGRDFRGPDYGRLAYVGEHALQWQGSGDFFFKVGNNHPEVFLEYEDYDNTPSSRSYDAHLADWQSGDPSWQGGKGKGAIGAMNYLSSAGMNVQYFLTMNTRGDGKKAWPWTASEAIWDYDVSKLAQWGIVFDHMMSRGIMPHFVLDERENQSLFEHFDPSSDTFADSRKLYYREMVARFGYLNAITWNVGEENGWSNGSVYGQSTTTAQRKERAAYLRDLSPYADHIVVHNGPSNNDDIFIDLVGDPSFTGPSFQGNYSSTNHGNGRIAHWRQASAAAGRKWVVTYDEPYVGGQPDRDEWRTDSLWASIAAGGAGCELYTGKDTSLQDWREHSDHHQDMRRAKDFLHEQAVPFWRMQPDNDLVSSGWALATAGEVYLVYLKSGGSTTLDLAGVSGDYSVHWFDPRNGGALQTGSIASVSGGGSRSLGDPPSDASSDWAILVRAVGGGDNQDPTITAGPTADPATVTTTTTQLSVSAEDGDGDDLNYQWSLQTGPAGASPQIGAGEDPTVTFDYAGAYSFRVTVSDGRGGSVSADVAVTVEQTADFMTIE